MEPDEKRTGRLLGGEDVPSVVEEEEVLQRVMHTVDAQRSQGPRWLAIFTPVAAIGLAAAGVFFFVTPDYSEYEVETYSEPAPFTPRGGEETTALQLKCVPGPECQIGSEVLLRVDGAPQKRHLAAFGQTADGTIIWYVPPSEIEVSIPFSAGEWLKQALVIGGEHTVGSHRIHVFLSELPLTRKDVRRLAEAKDDNVMHFVRTIEVVQ